MSHRHANLIGVLHVISVGIIGRPDAYGFLVMRYLYAEEATNFRHLAEEKMYTKYIVRQYERSSALNSA